MPTSSVERIHKTRDVFGISRDLPENYVTRAHVDGKFVESLTRSKHLIVHGGSKQGKTSLRKYNLTEKDYIVISCQNRWDVAELNSSILKSAGYEITQSNSKTNAGKNKIVAKADGSGSIPFIGSIEAGGELSRETASESGSETRPLDLDPSDVNDIIGALEKLRFRRFIILEDFHYLPAETQRDFSFALKAFHEQSKLTFIIVGVWKEENRLTRFNGDLSNRIIPIDADTWEAPDLRAVIAAGEALLNINFTQDFKDDLSQGCFNSVYIVQEACFKVCEDAGVFETKPTLTEINTDQDAGYYIKEVVKEQSGRYRAFINAFAAGFSPTGLEMYKWIIFSLLKGDVSKLDQGLRLNQVVNFIKARHPKGRELQTANVTNALTNVSSLQTQKALRPMVLDYDENERRLDIVDKGFLVWLSVADIGEILQELEFPEIPILSPLVAPTIT